MVPCPLFTQLEASDSISVSWLCNEATHARMAIYWKIDVELSMALLLVTFFIAECNAAQWDPKVTV